MKHYSFDWEVSGHKWNGANPPRPCWRTRLGKDAEGLIWECKVDDLRGSMNGKGEYVIKFDCWDPDIDTDPFLAFNLYSDDPHLTMSDYWKQIEVRFQAVYCQYEEIADRLVEFCKAHNID